MRIAIMSDLHLEYHHDKGVEFIASLNSDNVDALILAGDVAEIDCLEGGIGLFCEKYKHVIMVPGNHEYYGSDAGSVWFNFEQISEKYRNFHLLDNKILELNGKRFLGTTLWYPYVSPNKSKDWSDFNYIRNFSDWVYEENKKSVDFLNENLKEDDIVISHYLPSPMCVDPKYAGHSTNCFFITNVESLIEERKPAMWFFGHTHRHVDVEIGKTRLIANPRGYTMFHESIEENGFDDALKIDI